LPKVHGPCQGLKAFFMEEQVEKIILCRSCKNNPPVNKHFPFCSEICHTSWAEENYPSKTTKSNFESFLERGRRLKNKI